MAHTASPGGGVAGAPCRGDSSWTGASGGGASGAAGGGAANDWPGRLRRDRGGRDRAGGSGLLSQFRRLRFVGHPAVVRARRSLRGARPQVRHLIEPAPRDVQPGLGLGQRCERCLIRSTQLIGGGVSGRGSSRLGGHRGARPPALGLGGHRRRRLGLLGLGGHRGDDDLARPRRTPGRRPTSSASADTGRVAGDAPGSSGRRAAAAATPDPSSASASSGPPASTGRLALRLPEPTTAELARAQSAASTCASLSIRLARTPTSSAAIGADGGAGAAPGGSQAGATEGSTRPRSSDENTTPRQGSSSGAGVQGRSAGRRCICRRRVIGSVDRRTALRRRAACGGAVSGLACARLGACRGCGRAPRADRPVRRQARAARVAGGPDDRRIGWLHLGHRTRGLDATAALARRTQEPWPSLGLRGAGTRGSGLPARSSSPGSCSAGTPGRSGRCPGTPR